MKNKIRLLALTAGVLLAVAVLPAAAQTSTLAAGTGTANLQDQAGTLAGLFGVNTTNGVWLATYKGFSDGLAFLEGNTNGFARVTLEAGYLKTPHSGAGGFMDCYFPLSGTNNVLGAGFGIAYINGNWYDATLGARLGDEIPLPLGLRKIFPLYGYVESGGGYNFGSSTAIAQAFTGASLHYSLYRTATGNTVDFTIGYALGTISDVPGITKAVGGSVTFNF